MERNKDYTLDGAYAADGYAVLVFVNRAWYAYCGVMPSDTTSQWANGYSLVDDNGYSVDRHHTVKKFDKYTSAQAFAVTYAWDVPTQIVRVRWCPLAWEYYIPSMAAVT